MKITKIELFFMGMVFLILLCLITGFISDYFWRGWDLMPVKFMMFMSLVNGVYFLFGIIKIENAKDASYFSVMFLIFCFLSIFLPIIFYVKFIWLGLLLIWCIVFASIGIFAMAIQDTLSSVSKSFSFCYWLNFLTGFLVLKFIPPQEAEWIFLAVTVSFSSVLFFQNFNSYKKTVN